MKAWGWRAILACALAALALPASVAAKPGYRVKPKSLHLKLRLPASNGYSAKILTNGHRQVTLTLVKGGFSATYTALGRVTRKGIEADFGSFGHISLRFRGKRHYHPSLIPGLPLPDRCKGRRTVGERGMFVGSVRFDGERGYAQVRAHRAAGTAVRAYRRVCTVGFRAGASAANPSEEDLFLDVAGRRGGVLRFLIGIRSPILGLTLAVGGEEKKVGRVALIKTLGVIDYPRAIRIDPRGKDPLTASVKLAKPFEGSATYVKEGKAPPVWSGTLGIRLPGSGLVPLTGPEFEAEICRAVNLDELDRCSGLLLEDQPFRRYFG